MKTSLDKYSLRDLENIFEETNYDLRRNAWERVVKRVKFQNITPTYLGVDKNGIINFKTTSGTTRGLFWYQQIKFKDLETGLEILQGDPKVTAKEIINLLQKGDLLVYCNDLSFKYYGWQYIGTIRGYSLRKEGRYPRRRNPNLSGTICKHLVSVLQVLPFYTNTIVKDMRLKGILPR